MKGGRRAAAAAAARSSADARDLAQMRRRSRAAFHRDRDRFARLRRVGEAGERRAAHAVFEARDGRRSGRGHASLRLRALSRLRARSRRARRASHGDGFSRCRRSSDAARHRADARDVRSHRPRIRHRVFPLVLPDPAVAAAGIADRRQSECLHRSRDGQSSRGTRAVRAACVAGVSRRARVARCGASRCARTIARRRASISNTIAPISNADARSRVRCACCGARRA